MRQFSNKVIEELGYYVYALIDPRDHKIFYIGKGYGNRVFQHCLAAIQEDDETLKLNTIRAILNSGLEVGHYILRHKLSEEEALQMESLLIDVLTYSGVKAARRGENGGRTEGCDAFFARKDGGYGIFTHL